MKGNFKSWEFKYISEPAMTVQKLLNQWKHEFDMIILLSEFDTPSGDVIKNINMLMARRHKHQVEEV